MSDPIAQSFADRQRFAVLASTARHAAPPREHPLAVAAVLLGAAFVFLGFAVVLG